MKKDNYQREYTENEGKTQVKEEGYTQVEKTQNGGKKTTTYESKTMMTKYVDESQFVNENPAVSVKSNGTQN
jgi:hypothetical protein